MNVAPDPQVIANQEMYSPGTRWCAIAKYSDGSGILGVYGPYRRKANANDAVKNLIEAGVYVHDDWTVMPLRQIDMGSSGA